VPYQPLADALSAPGDHDRKIGTCHAGTVGKSPRRNNAIFTLKRARVGNVLTAVEIRLF
jgi:hypothetical protein